MRFGGESHGHVAHGSLTKGVGMRRFLGFFLAAATVLVVAAAPGGAAVSKRASSAHDALGVLGSRMAVQDLNARSSAPAQGSPMIARNFEVLGHHNLGMQDENGDVWVHGNFAYVGTWASPCTGRGVKVVDVSNPRAPQMVSTFAARFGTSAEDMVVRRVSTPSFTGDLAAVGIQRCFTADNEDLDRQRFGASFWDVTDPRNPRQLGFFGTSHGSGGVHELDIFQRGTRAYALLASPFREFFDPVPQGDFSIVDITNPRRPVQVSEWGAKENGLTRGPFWGQGSFGASFAHSARISEDGMHALVSYWDIGVLRFDITDPENPVLVSRTRYPRTADGDAHSASEYISRGRHFILQNDEDFDPRNPATIYLGAVPNSRNGMATESPGGTPLWFEPNHRITDRVVRARNEGCRATDYPANARDNIVVVRTPFPFFDPEGGDEPDCSQSQQDEMAETAGARAVVHDFISSSTSPQWFDFGDVDIPVLFTSHGMARLMVENGSATLAARTLRARWPSWGYMRIYDAETGGRQVSRFDQAPNVHKLPAPKGDWSIHNNEVFGDRAYASWYTNGVIAINLMPLHETPIRRPTNVGQFAPPGAPSRSPFIHSDVAMVWGVVVREADGLLFVSDMNSGLWIVRPTGPAAP